MGGEQSRRALASLVALALAPALLVACGSGADEGSDQFRDQTTSPLLDFGEEGSEAEREAGAAVVEDFLAARASEDWPAACAQLARPMLAKIEHLASSATDLEDKSCPSFLAAFTRLSARERREGEALDAGSLRRRGRRAYLLYHGAEEVPYSMPLSREGGAWKVASLAPEPLG